MNRHKTYTMRPVVHVAKVYAEAQHFLLFLLFPLLTFSLPMS